MCFFDFASQGIRRRFVFFCCVWIAYGFYYYGINWLKNPNMTALEVAFSIPVFVLIAHGVYVIIDRFLAKRRLGMGSAVLLAFYMVVARLTHWLVNIVNGLIDDPLNGGNYIEFFDIAFLAHLATIISNYSLFGIAAYFVVSSIRNAKAKQAEAEARLEEAERRLGAEREKRRFEYFMLAGQVSPHFIVNLLNGWQVKLQHTQPAIVESMERAYELMVYYMEAREPTKRRVPLALEVERLENYVALTTAFGSPKYIQCTCYGELEGYTIPPTALLDLIENSTKHGRTDLPDNPIRMDITVANNQLRCVCTNVIKDSSDRESHGVGLANLTRRLQLEYNRRYRLECKKERNTFIAQLTINY